jgi:hypothetical protein
VSIWSWKRDELQSETLLTKVSLEGLDLCPEVADFVLWLGQLSEFASRFVPLLELPCAETAAFCAPPWPCSSPASRRCPAYPSDAFSGGLIMERLLSLDFACATSP